MSESKIQKKTPVLKSLFKIKLQDSSMLLYLESRAYFRKEKRPGIGRFVKKCPFPEKLFFLNLNQKSQNHFWLGGIWPPPAPLAYPSAFLSNKGAFSLKQKVLFQEQFYMNDFYIFHNFCFKKFLIHTSHLLDNVWYIMKYML